MHAFSFQAKESTGKKGKKKKTQGMTWLSVGEQERVDVPKQEREENNRQTQTKECEKKVAKKPI